MIGGLCVEAIVIGGIAMNALGEEPSRKKEHLAA